MIALIDPKGVVSLFSSQKEIDSCHVSSFYRGVLNTDPASALMIAGYQV